MLLKNFEFKCALLKCAIKIAQLIVWGRVCVCFGFWGFFCCLGGCWDFLTSGRKQVQLYLQRVKILGSPEPGTHGTLFHPHMGLCRTTLSAHIPKAEQMHQVVMPKQDFDEERLRVASSLTHPEHIPGLCLRSFINSHDL